MLSSLKQKKLLPLIANSSFKIVIAGETTSTEVKVGNVSWYKTKAIVGGRITESSDKLQVGRRFTGTTSHWYEQHKNDPDVLAIGLSETDEAYLLQAFDLDNPTTAHEVTAANARA